MNYNETINFLFSQLPMYSRVGAAAYKADLINTISLLKTLGNPHQKFKSVHIAGTNGKGSVSHSLAAVFQQAGYKTGLYTSPHIFDFRERIRINGKKISENFVVEFVEKIKNEIETIKPSFFEITVAMAFDYFALEKVDIAIIEVGLGGRLDSTNVITPELSVITNISFDHTNLLGNTIEQIALEKAGIIKPNTPVVVGETQPETEKIFISTANQNNAPIAFADKNFSIENYFYADDKLEIIINENNQHKKYFLDLCGLYQLKNCVTTLAAIRQLQNKGWKISEENIYDGLSSVKQITRLRGRWEKIYQSPSTYIDVAHNPAGIEQVLHHLSKMKYSQLHFVVGMVKDKDVNSSLSILPATATYYFTQANIPRALPKENLQTMAKNFGLMGDVHHNVNVAITAAQRASQAEDIVVVLGSIYLIAEINLFKI